MSFKKELELLDEARKILKKHQDRKSVSPKLGGFYRTLNDSIVYIAEQDASDGTAKAIILSGGFQSDNIGDSYWLDQRGKYLYGQTTQMVLSLRERLALRLPKD